MRWGDNRKLRRWEFGLAALIVGGFVVMALGAICGLTSAVADKCGPIGSWGDWVGAWAAVVAIMGAFLTTHSIAASDSATRRRVNARNASLLAGYCDEAAKYLEKLASNDPSLQDAPVRHIFGSRAYAAIELIDRSPLPESETSEDVTKRQVSITRARDYLPSLIAYNFDKGAHGSLLKYAIKDLRSDRDRLQLIANDA